MSDSVKEWLEGATAICINCSTAATIVDHGDNATMTLRGNCECPRHRRNSYLLRLPNQPSVRSFPDRSYAISLERRLEAAATDGPSIPRLGIQGTDKHTMPIRSVEARELLWLYRALLAAVKSPPASIQEDQREEPSRIVIQAAHDLADSFRDIARSGNGSTMEAREHHRREAIKRFLLVATPPADQRDGDRWRAMRAAGFLTLDEDGRLCFGVVGPACNANEERNVVPGDDSLSVVAPYLNAEEVAGILGNNFSPYKGSTTRAESLDGFADAAPSPAPLSQTTDSK